MAGWGVRREDLVEAVRILDLVPSHTGIPSSDYFCIERVGDNGEVGFKTAAGAVAEIKVKGTGKWPYQKPFYLDRRSFSPFVTIAKEITNKNQFEFSDQGRLLIKHGSREQSFDQTLNLSGYATLNGLKGLSELTFTDEVIQLMMCASNFAASELQSPNIACVYVMPLKGGIQLLSTNQKILFKAKVKMEHQIQESIPFPVAMIQVMKAEGLKKLTWGEKCIIGKFDMGKVWQMIAESGMFPYEEILKILDEGNKPEYLMFRVSGYEFAKVVGRIAFCLQSVRKEDWVLTIKGEKGASALKLLSILPSTTLKEQVETVETIKKEFTIQWPLNMLDPIFQFIGKEDEKRVVEVRLNKNGDFSYIKCGVIEMCVPAKVA